MSFWDNVVNELNFIGMTNKALAEKAGFDPSNIGRGLRYKSSPSAETAVKIAKILGVSVEYLVSGEDIKNPNDKISIMPNEIRKIKKYSSFIDNLERLPIYEKDCIIEMVEKLSLAHKDFTL